MNLKLTVELVPSTAWYENVRKAVSKSHWDLIRKECYHRAGHTCEICGAGGRLDCHEIWKYSETPPWTQTLTGLIALCPDCHRVKHAGLALVQQQLHLVLDQLCKVNQMDPDDAYEYLEQCFALYQTRSQFSWKTDISFIDSYLKS